jgi:hypothetical protein
MNEAMPDVDFVGRLLKFWDDRGIRYLKAIAPDEIRAFERQSGIILPEQLRAFYSATNGLRVPESSEADDQQFDFWPLEDLSRVTHAPTKVYFADVLQSAWEYAIEVEGSETSSKGAIYVATTTPVQIASSFACFVDRYIENDASLYPGSWYHPDGPRLV